MKNKKMDVATKITAQIIVIALVITAKLAIFSGKVLAEVLITLVKLYNEKNSQKTTKKPASKKEPCKINGKKTLCRVVFQHNHIGYAKRNKRYYYVVLKNGVWTN